MIKVNLVPQEILDKELQKQRLAQVSVAAAFIGVFFLAVSFSHYYKSVTLADRLVEAEAEFKRLEVIVKQVEELEAKAKAVKARLDVIGDLLMARPFYPRFMTRLLEALGDGIWLSALNVSGSAPNITVNMSCQATGVEAVTRWLRALQTSASFKEPSMGGLVIAADGLVTFSMSLKYKPDAPAAAK
ncbi:MAG: hypothetical protein HYZ75_17830 [Elusimicrobia bacterium]|nr:hypothetical protein [Elusimicrobiota bacterium]